jgi:RND family efflux transporter MFP subunit
MNHRTVIHMLTGLALTAALLFAGCGKKEQAEPEPVARPLKTIVVGGDAFTDRSYPGEVEASQRVDLSFRVSGPLIELHAERGQYVEKGYLIARIDPRDYQIALEEAKATFTKADADLKRYQSLYEKNAVSLAELEQKRSQRDVTRARMEDAQSNVDYTYLRAPFEGNVSERYVENFQEVSVQQPIVSLENFDMLDIIVDVPEHLMTGTGENLQKMEITATFDSAPDKKYPLTFKAVTAQADPTTRTYQIRFSMEQPEEINVLTGMTANVTASSNLAEMDASVFIIPAAAVFEDDAGSPAVWVVGDDMTVRKRSIGVGELTGEAGIEVTDGLEAGERVAVVAVHSLTEGTKVRILDK